ncbi:MAG: HlyD family efflux transporter periplasmic adaptor subunit [Planctomycetota bacterium]|nr:MAG: HlyD family efflux transporter periplasmic adaptor subunit [Planctomycetota bacterium]
MERLIRLVFLSFGMAALLMLPCACANGANKNSGAADKPAAEKPGPEETPPVVEEKPVVKKKPAEKAKPVEKKKPGDLSGILALATTCDVKAELKAYSGKLLLKSLIEPGTPVKKGDVLALLEAPDMDDTLKEAGNSLESIEQSYASLKAENERAAKSDKLKLDRAKHSLKTTEDNLDKWNKEERVDKIRSAEMNIERLRHSIEDQKDELAQLDKLYEGNELAKESQDIVLKRARRNLKRSEESLVLRERSHKRFLDYDIPKTDKDKAYAVDSAMQTLQKILDDRKEDKTLVTLKIRLNRTAVSVRKAKEKLDDLQKDMDNLTLKAPFDGIAVVGKVAGNPGTSAKLKVGDKIAKGSVVAGVFDPALFTVTVQVPAKKAVTINKGAKAQVKVAAFDLTLPGTVKARALTAKADKVAVVIEVRGKEQILFPGLSGKVTFPEE